MENEQILTYTNSISANDCNSQPFWLIVTSDSEPSRVASLELLTATGRVTRIWSMVSCIRIKNETRGYKMRRLTIELTVRRSDALPQAKRLLTLEPGQTVEYTVNNVGDVDFQIIAQNNVYFTDPKKSFTKEYGNTYDIETVIFVNLDSVTTPLFLPLLKKAYGDMDIIHSIRKNHFNGMEVSDSQLLKACGKSVILTCWNENRTADAVCNYCYDLDLDVDKIRIYSLVNKFNFNIGNK